MEMTSVIQQSRERLVSFVREHRLSGEEVRVKIGTLSSRQAIGIPERKDFPLLVGKEVMIEAQFRDSCGQAFTSRPETFEGIIDDVVNLDPGNTSNRAIFFATLNAITVNLKIVTGTRHCRDEEPEKCGAEIAKSLLSRFGRIKIGMVGYQPAILYHLAQNFGVDNVRCSDLDPKNVGSLKHDVLILDGEKENINLIRWCDLMLITSSTCVNGSFDVLNAEVIAQRKRLIVFGVTGASVAALLGIERICPFAH